MTLTVGTTTGISGQSRRVTFKSFTKYTKIIYQFEHLSFNLFDTNSKTDYDIKSTLESLLN